MNAATYKNRAVGQLRVLKDGFQSTYSNPKLSVNQVAAMSALRGGDATEMKKGILTGKGSQNQTLMLSAGIALVLLIVFYLAIKYKFVKL